MRDTLRTLLAILFVIVLGWLGYKVIFPAEEPGPLLVQQVEGSVSHVDAAGVRSDATIGLALGRMDRIVASEDGRAVLSFGDENTVSLQHGTSIRVLGVTSEGVRMELDEGRIEATVRPGRGSLGIVNRNREISATDATFAVGVNQAGGIAVESRQGQLLTSGLRGVETIDEGQRVVATEGSEARVSPIPESLLLEVAWPETARTREAEVMVRGRTDPGAEVRVGTSGRWTAVIAGADGRFMASLPLNEGPNPVQVVSEDPLGRSTTTEGEVVRDTRPPAGATFEVHY